MGTGGFSKARLGRMHDVMAGYIERGDVPGLVTMVSRRGEVHVEAIGTTTLGGSDPIRRDSIFRISSMTKPITAAATMILIEECKLRLDEPVDRLVPELSRRKVLKRLDGPLDDTVPANRPITVRDLLTFRMGFGVVMAPPDTYPIQKAMSQLLLGQGPPSPSTPPALARGVTHDRRLSCRSGLARQRSRMGAPVEKLRTYSSRSSNVGSAQWMSSTTRSSGRSRPSASNSLRNAHAVSSGEPAPSATPSATAILPATTDPDPHPP